MRATASDGRQALPGLLAAVLALALVVAASFTRPWHALEFKTFDLFAAIAAPGPGGPPLAVVAVDEPSFQQLGQAWPFARSLHARLVERLVADGARAIAFDVVFAEPSTPHEDAALASAIAAARDAGVPVVLAAAREQNESAGATLWTQVQPLPALLAAGALAGDAGVWPDDDFVVRRHPAAPDALAAVLARALAPDVPAEPPDFIAYRGPRGTFDTRSYYQALEPGLLPPGFFHGKVVFIGRSARTASELARSQADLFNAPFAALGGERLFPGVELHATLLENRLTGRGLNAADEGWTALVAALGLGLLAAVVARRWPPSALAGGVAVLCAAVVALSAALHARAGVWLSPLLPVGMLTSAYIATALVGHAQARRRARQIRAMFAQYVPAPVVARLIAEPALLRLGGESREVTLMFTDLAGFTSVSERLSPEQTVELLGLVFGALSPLVHASGGTLDKYIGDALMAFWGAPLPDAHHAEHAVRAALAMQAAMGPLGEALAARGLPPVAMRIGLHTGRVVVGNVGSAERFSYTAIGDAVNLAARLEGANKAFGTGILLSQATAERLPVDLPLRVLDAVVVKGKSEAVRVYTPCADAALCEAARAALDAFERRDWAAARAHLHAVLARAPHDLAAARLLERLESAAALAPGAPWSAAVSLDKL